MTQNLPSNILASLLEHRLRTPLSVLSIIEMIPDPHRRALSLTRLAAQLVDSGLEGEVIDVALKIDDEAARAEALAGIVASVPVEALRRLLPAVRALAEVNRTRALAALSERGDMPEPVLAAVLDEAAGLKSEEDAALVLSRLGPHLGAELAERAAVRAARMRSAAAMARVAAVVAPRLRDGGQELLDAALRKAQATRVRTQRVQALSALGHHSEAVTEAEQIPAAHTRIECLATFAAHLSPRQLAHALEGVLTPGQARWKATALAALAPHVPARQWSRLLRNVISIEVRDARARALAAIAPHLPRVLVPRLVQSALELPLADRQAAVLRAAAGRLEEPELAAVLAKVKRMRRHGDRGTLLAAVAAHLSETQAEEALTFVRRIGSMTDRALAVDALAQRLSGPSLEEAIASLDIDDDDEALATLAALARWVPDAYRSEALRDLVALHGAAWPDGLESVSESLTPDLLEEILAEIVGPERSSSVRELRQWSEAATEIIYSPAQASERKHVRADALARLSAAAPLIAEARAKTTASPGSTWHPGRRKDESPAILDWLRAAEVLLPDSAAVRRALYSAFSFVDPWSASEPLQELIELLVELERVDDAVAERQRLRSSHDRPPTVPAHALRYRSASRSGSTATSRTSGGRCSTFRPVPAPTSRANRGAQRRPVAATG